MIPPSAAQQITCQLSMSGEHSHIHDHGHWSAIYTMDNKVNGIPDEPDNGMNFHVYCPGNERLDNGSHYIMAQMG